MGRGPAGVVGGWCAKAAHAQACRSWQGSAMHSTPPPIECPAAQPACCSPTHRVRHRNEGQIPLVRRLQAAAVARPQHAPPHQPAAGVVARRRVGASGVLQHAAAAAWRQGRVKRSDQWLAGGVAGEQRAAAGGGDRRPRQSLLCVLDTSPAASHALTSPRCSLPTCPSTLRAAAASAHRRSHRRRWGAMAGPRATPRSGSHPGGRQQQEQGRLGACPSHRSAA